MSEGSYIPPVPPPPVLPPPPPPPGGPSSSVTTPSGFDFGKPFTFVFEDPNWMGKILIGGLFYIAAFFIIGIFFILGYCAQLTRNVVAGMPRPLPDWDKLGDYFGEGLRLFGALLLYALPMLILAGLFVVPALIVENQNFTNDTGREILGTAAGCVWCLMVPLAIGMTLWLPAAGLRVVMTGRFGAAFEFGAIWALIKNNIGNYLLAVVVGIIARFLGGFGVILFCIGVVFTGFWAFLVQTHALAQVWKLADRP
ncbi:MAG TPA: DUF4013 domain-containing protein [Thermoanaerobaculia bacterium]|jgi:hypothetical protein